MVAINWEWAFTDGRRVPSVDELKVLALRLLRETIESSKKTNGIAIHATGGFSVTVLNNTAHLEFVLESWIIDEV